MTAPPPGAPGAHGVAILPGEILAYLAKLTDWRDDLQSALERLDARARIASDADDLVPDISLAFALLQAISTRVDEIVAVWDSGRVGHEERVQIAALVWGRLGGNLQGVLAVSFTEACVLADALIDRLADRLEVDPLGAPGVGERIGPLREQLARCRAHAGSTEREAEIAALEAALEAAVADATAGLDRRDELTRIWREASALERDLIIGGAARSGIGRDAADLGSRLHAAADLEAETREVATRCAEKVADAPRLAIPSVAAIGAVPPTTGRWRTDRPALDAFAARLELVEEALQEAHDRFATPLRRRDELRGLFGAYRDMAGRRGVVEDPAVGEAGRATKALLWSSPLDLDAADKAVRSYEQLVRERTAPDVEDAQS